MVSCTIVIPTHNRGELLVRAVRSALQACPADGEVLVVDDKSLIPAAQVLVSFADARLKVMRNDGSSGAASSRNLGVSSANGKLSFFLDDDDEICPDYCQRVLDSAGLADWGFCCSVQRWVLPHPNDVLTTRRSLQHGQTGGASKPRDLVAAASDGFWIKTRVFLEMGGLDTELVIDEDTDLCVRLLAASRYPWYEPDPGVIVYRGYQPLRSEGAQLTVTTPKLPAVLCYRRTYEKNSDRFSPLSRMRWFLLTRFIRRAVKAGEIDMAAEIVRTLEPSVFRWCAKFFLLAKAFVLR